MINEPLFKSVPTYRNYEDYHDAEQYTRGWNDAMRFIFGVDKNRDEHCQHICEEAETTVCYGYTGEEDEE